MGKSRRNQSFSHGKDPDLNDVAAGGGAPSTTTTTTTTTSTTTTTTEATEPIVTTTMVRVESTARPARGESQPRHVDVARGVHGDATAIFISTAAQVGAPKVLSGGAELDHEDIRAAVVRRVEPVARPAGRVGGACHVDVARGIHGDAADAVVTAAAYVRAPDVRSAGAECDHERIVVAIVGGVEALARPARY